MFRIYYFFFYISKFFLGKQFDVSVTFELLTLQTFTKLLVRVYSFPRLPTVEFSDRYVIKLCLKVITTKDQST